MKRSNIIEGVKVDYSKRRPLSAPPRPPRSNISTNSIMNPTTSITTSSITIENNNKLPHVLKDMYNRKQTENKIDFRTGNIQEQFPITKSVIPKEPKLTNTNISANSTTNRGRSSSVNDPQTKKNSHTSYPSKERAGRSSTSTDRIFSLSPNTVAASASSISSSSLKTVRNNSINTKIINDESINNKTRRHSANYVQALKSKVKEVKPDHRHNIDQKSASKSSVLSSLDEEMCLLTKDPNYTTSLCSTLPQTYLFHENNKNVEIIWAGSRLLQQSSIQQVQEISQARKTILPSPKKDQLLMDTLRSHEESRLLCYEKFLISMRHTTKKQNAGPVFSFGSKKVSSKKDLSFDRNKVVIDDSYYLDKGRQSNHQAL